jgi:hypothetical protein
MNEVLDATWQYPVCWSAKESVACPGHLQPDRLAHVADGDGNIPVF